MQAEDGQVCERCLVTVDFEGVATAHYRWVGAVVDGYDQLEEDVTDWTDDEIREAVAQSIGMSAGIDEIEIEREGP